MAKKTIENNGYYSLTEIDRKKADYNIIIGERSNGKTYACLKRALDNYLQKGKHTAYIRRWAVDFTGKRSQQLFASVLKDYKIEEKTDGKFNEIFCVGNKWYLSYFNEETGKRRIDITPFCFGFALSEMEHEKSVSYPDVNMIIFDEFLTRSTYLKDEFILFMNVLSTIIRSKTDVKIYMLGNTVNRYAPYFAEMGIKNIENQKQGTIDVYKFGQITIAVEYCAETQIKKESNKYFAFDNERLEMVTSGKWELNAYPHLPNTFKPKDIQAVFYVVFGDTVLQGNVIMQNSELYCFIHKKTNELGDVEPPNIVYTLEPSVKPNYFRKLLNNNNLLCSKITNLFATDKVFYQSNEVGDTIRNYILTSMKNNLTI